MKDSPFLGRTIQVVQDLSVDEQVYLYEKTRRLKHALQNHEPTEEFRLERSDGALYLLFMEDSTRTKESFRNAAKFHGLRVNDFTAGSSSFNKKESITDTIRMLTGYADTSIFVVRTKLEGVCRWLESSIGEYARSAGLCQPAFINAGDGRHEHPTQEFLDEFSFLEQKNWSRSHLHLALVGDLFHGRTVHSKVNGLKVFHEVEVDLVAPPELEMPPYYVSRMRDNGFQVRVFGSIDEYLSQPKVASTWYFTRLQLERMGERLRDKAETLRAAVTFVKPDLNRLPENTKFFHPLPRHRETPVIPTFLDSLPVNGWDRQSMNGYYTRIIEIAMVGGRLGSDFEGEARQIPEFPDDFIESASIVQRNKPEYKIGIKPVETGIVIDHIGTGKSPQQIFDHISKIREILHLNCVSSHGVFQSLRTKHHKGIISVPDFKDLDAPQMKMLGAIAPGCTINKIMNERVVEKFRLRMPPRVYNLPGIGCKNEDCVSHTSHGEPVVPEFYRAENELFTCRYCEHPHRFSEIW